MELIIMNAVVDFYTKNLQDFLDRPLIQASGWSFRTIRDLRSVTKKSDVLTTADRVAIFFRGIIAILAWFPIHLLAIPYTFIMGSLKQKNKIKPIPQLHEIAPGLYLGSDQAAKSATMLKEKNITSVLSILGSETQVPKDQVTRHKWIKMEDYPDVNIAPVVEQALKFVQQSHQENQNVLIHCKMGMSRSASVMVSLMQKISGMPPEKAIAHVKSKRPVIDMNYGFKQQILRSGCPQNAKI